MVALQKDIITISDHWPYSCDFVFLHDILRHSDAKEVFYGVSVATLVFLLDNVPKTLVVLILCYLWNNAPIVSQSTWPPVLKIISNM